MVSGYEYYKAEENVPRARIFDKENMWTFVISKVEDGW